MHKTPSGVTAALPVTRGLFDLVARATWAALLVAEFLEGCSVQQASDDTWRCFVDVTHETSFLN